MSDYKGIICWLLLLGFWLGPVSQAQVFLEGVVLDKERGAALSGSYIEYGDLRTRSNSEGYFRLDLAPLSADKQHVLRVQHLGYAAYADTVRVTDKALIEVRLAVLNYALSEVVVRGLRLHEQAPLARRRLNENDIKQAHVGQNVAFLLAQTTPSMTTASESGAAFTNYARLYLRGLDASRINFTLNGMPLNDVLDQVYYSSNTADLSASMSSIEVQRGVGSSSYGVASYAGSVNMQGRSAARQAPGASLALGGGSFNTWRLSGALSSGLNENGIAAYGRISRLQSNGFRERSGTEAFSGYFTSSLQRKRALWQLTLFSGRTKNNLAYVVVPETELDKNRQANPILPKETDDYAQSLVLVERIDSLNARHRLASGLYYNHVKGIFPFGYLDETGAYQAIVYGLRNHHLGWRQLWTYEAPRRGLRMGLHAYGFFRRNDEAMRPSITNPYYEDNTRKYEGSLFAKYYEQRGGWRFFVDVQGRYIGLSMRPKKGSGEGVSKVTRTWLFVDPKIGLSYAWDGQHAWYASAGIAHREPTRNDLLGDTQLNQGTYQALVAGEEPTPERVFNLETGIRRTARQWRGNLNVFYMHFSDQITPIGRLIEDFYAQLRQNVPRSYRLGAEVEGACRLASPLTLETQWSWMMARIEKYAPKGSGQVHENVWPAMTPQWNGSLSLRYTPLKWFSTSINGRYIGDMRIDPARDEWRIPAAYVMGWHTEWRWRKHYSLHIQVNNLLDRRYYGYGEGTFDVNNNAFVPGYLPQPPRNVFVSFRANW